MQWEGGRQSENVEDRRAMSPAAIAGGGGIGMLIIFVLAYFLTGDAGKAKQIAGGLGNILPKAQGQLEQTGGGQPINDKTLKFVKTVIGYTEDVWDEIFAKSGKTYQKPKMVLFRDAVQTQGCGSAPAAVGPFYCPADKTVYLDPSFFDTLEQELKGSKAEFSQAYVIAHEVGHHVQNLLGFSQLVDAARAKGKAAGNDASVRLELQADYLAGVWAHYAQRHFKLDPGDLDEALTSAKAIGDDVLMKNAGKYPSPENFTHGSAQQRVKYFRLGFETGDLGQLKKFFQVAREDL